MRRRTNHSLVLAWLVFACGTAGGALAQGRVVAKDGVKHVLNSAVPENQQNVPTVELWRRGGAEDEVVLGTVGGVACDRNGKAYVLDVQRNEVHVIAPNGKYVGTIGRDGEGPGEFRMASGLAFLSDSVLCVTQAVPARAVRMTSSGRSMADHPLSPELVGTFINGCAAVDGLLAICCGQTVREQTFVGFRTRYGVLDATGKLTSAQWELFQKADLASIEFDEKADAEPVWAFAPDGRFLVNNDWDHYAVQVIDAKGRTVHVVEREYQHRPRTKAELGAIEAQKQAGQMPVTAKVSSTSRDVVRLLPRADGKMWVLSSRGDMDVSPGTIAAFDEFDRAGNFVKTVTIRGDRRPGADSFYVVDDLVFVVTNDTNAGDSAGAGELELICLRMKVGP